MMDRPVSLVQPPNSFFPSFNNASALHPKQTLQREVPQMHQPPPPAPCSKTPSVSLEAQIAHQQAQIRALVARLPPNAALDSLLLSAMLASPSTAPSSRISAALDAVAATAAAACPFSAAGAVGSFPAPSPRGILPAPPALPPLPLPWSIRGTQQAPGPGSSPAARPPFP